MRQKVLSLFNQVSKEIKDNNLYMVMLSVFLFDFLDRLKLKKFPDDWFILLEKEITRITNCCNLHDDLFETSVNNLNDWKDNIEGENIQVRTGEVYFNLWKEFKKEEYYDQTYNILKERLDKNKISLTGVESALDSGCGGGRYTLALKKLGCQHVKGVDVSQNSIDFAKKMNLFSQNEVEFLASSVLELPFESESFDFVFSNGVLHHTTDTEKGLREIYRVMKTGGFCWLYLYGGKESLFWDIVDFCRKLLASVPQHYTQAVMKVLGYPPGRIFHRTDFFYVPINNRYFETEIEEVLKEIGYKSIKRLKRGVEHDWDEIIHHNPNIDPYIYGEGEMRFMINK
jgi:ubiquinone/menaquinone biosynthesis C-methylase UbiE